MLVTQSQALKAIRKGTGLSRQTCYELVRRMAKVKDGARNKVFSTDVDDTIRAHAKPARRERRTAKPFSPQMTARIAVSGK